MSSIADLAYTSPITSFITAGVPIVRLKDPIGAAIEKYSQNPSNRSLIVVDEQGKLAGIVTDQDLTGLVDLDRESPVEKLIKSPEVVAVRDNASLGQALRIMNGENPSGLKLDIVPVVDQDTRPVGVIKRNSLTADLADRLSKGAFRENL